MNSNNCPTSEMFPKIAKSDDSIPRHGGAVMLMVISLMTALAFLGFFFFAFVSADRNSAAWFASQQQDAQIVDDTDKFFDFALEQIILGPKQELTNSVLYGGKHSLVPNMIGNLDIFDEVGEFDSNGDGNLDPWEDLNGDGVLNISEPDWNYNGILDPWEDLNGNGVRDLYRNSDSQQVTDLHPYNGHGIKIVFNDTNGDGRPEDLNGDGLIDGLGFDYDNDGSPESGGLVLNYSAGANGWTGRLPSNSYSRYSPDVDYTYPDINNTYLAHFSWVPREEIDQNGNPIDINGNGTSELAYSPVWIPSFHRPQYLSEWRVGTTVANPWQHVPYLSSVLRPHASQQITFWNDGGDNNPNNDTVASGGGLRFQGTDANFFNAPLEGMWKDLTTSELADYSYDIDADGDGIKEAIYLDLDYPATELDSDGDGAFDSYYTALFGITILDAEGLINLNATGNLNHIKEDIVNNVDAPSTTIPQDIIRGMASSGSPIRFFSSSNEGYSTFEINPARALFANVTGYTATDPEFDLYKGMFKDNFSAISQYKMANYDLFRMIAGAPMFVDASTLSITSHEAAPGRYGEETNLVYDLLGIQNRVTGIDFPTGSLIVPGREQEREKLFTTIFSQAGGTEAGSSFANSVAIDDDNDAATGAGQGGVTSSKLLGLTIPPSVHPVDVLGIGNVLDVEYATTLGIPYTGASRLLFDTPAARVPPIPFNPSVWPYYGGTWQTLAPVPEYNIATWNVADFNLGTGSLIEGAASSLLFNEDDELTLEPDFLDQSRDGIFSVAEMEGLHFSDGDYNRPELAVTSRLRELMPFNFEDHGDAEAIRRQFTTIGWDRRELRFAPIPFDTSGSGGANRVWEFNLDISNPTYSLNPTTDFRGNFPPAYGLTQVERTSTAAVVAANVSALPYEDEDPFRSPVRRWLSMQENRIDITSFFPQSKLLAGQILELDPEENSLKFRPLTPHPKLSGVSVTTLQPIVHENSYEADLNSTPYDRADFGVDVTTQEWWARYDRQRLARDIYVLLYTLGGPDDLNVTTDGYGTDSAGLIDGNNNSIDDRVERMAQFAVNLVDAMDVDHHITRFDYDPDLSDGWDAFGSTLRTVYGVEEQRLAISEGMWIDTKRTGGTAFTQDAAVTLHKEYESGSEQEHQYFFLELRNTSPLSVPLNSNSYRVVRLSHDGGSGNLSDANTKQITFENVPDLPAGENFLIGSHDGNVVDGSGLPHDSVFRCRLDWNGNNAIDNPGNVDDDDVYRPIVPAFEEGGATGRTPILNNSNAVTYVYNDLDLCHDLHRNSTTPRNIFIEEETQPIGYFLKDNTNTNLINSSQDLIISLQRRQNIEAGTNLNPADNPWVEVDRITIRASNFNFPTSETGNTITARQALYQATPPASSTGLLAASGMASTLRADRFGEFVRFDNNPIRNTLYLHSMGELFPEGVDGSAATQHLHPQQFLFASSNQNTHNFNTDNTFQNWQPHFDRTHTSVIEFFSTPIVGPLRVSNSSQLGTGFATFTPKALAPREVNFYGKMEDWYTAGHWFLNPQGDPAVDPVVYPNRWYRALEFFELEPRIHQSIESLLSIRRTPGKVNVNTMRATLGQGSSLNPQAGYLAGLAALIDDEVHLSTTTFSLADPIEPIRDWGDQFRVARDGLDPVWLSLLNPVAVPMPGAVGSRPFRSLGFLDSTPAGSFTFTDNSIQSTLLRKLPFDNGDALPLSENTVLDPLQRRQIFEARTFDDIPDVNVDYHTRHRLLAKIHNNSTTISNVFYVFIGVEFFEATEQGSGQWSIGRKLTGDTSLSPEAQEHMKTRRGFFVVDRSLLEKAYDPTTGRVDFRKLILHRRKLEPYN